MPMVEIDEEELRKNRQLAGVVEKILANPKGRALLQQAHKEVNPEAVVPELETRQMIENSLSEVKKTVDDFVKSQKEEREAHEKAAREASAKSRIDEGFARLRQQGVTEEGIKGVEELMEREGILNPEVAFSHFEKLHPPPPLSTPTNFSGAWNFLQTPTDGGEDIKQLIESRGENNAVLDKMISQGLNEVRGVQPRR